MALSSILKNSTVKSLLHEASKQLGEVPGQAGLNTTNSVF